MWGKGTLLTVGGDENLYSRYSYLRGQCGDSKQICDSAIYSKEINPAHKSYLNPREDCS